jgi:hypothetical protein
MDRYCPILQILQGSTKKSASHKVSHMPPLTQRKIANLLLTAVLTGLIMSSLHFLISNRNNELSPENTTLPFGVFWNKETQIYTINDYATILNYSRQIWENKLERTYTLEAQEKLFKKWCASTPCGMPFAYSPTFLILTYPFLKLETENAFILFCLLNLNAFN